TLPGVLDAPDRLAAWLADRGQPPMRAKQVRRQILAGRAEAFACKNTMAYSIADGLGIGIGYTLALGALGAIREVLGKGSLTVWEDMSYGVASVFPSFHPFGFLVQAPGAFICLGLMLCILNAIGKK
ncbi:MAG: hypothetical protein M0Z56_12375, partial [Desulfobacteraceae bacterium]|nr:hypothetical protein [Desulfobacteraceae bacterium]